MHEYPYDERQVEIARQKLTKFRFTSCVDDSLAMLVYALPKNMKLVRPTNSAKQHQSFLSCMQCDSVLSPHPLNKICKKCHKVCCNQCFIKWSALPMAAEYAFPCMCELDHNDEEMVVPITEFENESGYRVVMERLSQLFLTCPFKDCRQKLSFNDFYRGHESQNR